MTRFARAAGRLAYGLAPRWLAAIIVSYDALREARQTFGEQVTR